MRLKCSSGFSMRKNLHSAGGFLCRKSLRVRIKGQTSKDDTVVGVCYRPPEREEEVNEASGRQLEAASRSEALVVVGDLSTLTSAGETTQSREAQRVQKVPGKH